MSSKADREPNVPYPVVVLGDGSFPTHPVPLGKLKSAKTVVCLDGAANRAMEHGFEPSLIIGDMDSFLGNPSQLSVNTIRLESQNTTDLEKALNWCAENDIREITLLGLSGDREDHALAAFLAMKEYFPGLHVAAVTDFFTIHYIEAYREFSAEAGQKVSLLSIPNTSNLTTRGLKFALENEPLGTGGRGISNEVLSGSFSVDVEDGGVFVFIAHPL
ncbi:MAG: thiamine diphosphokinase [Candidatus Neomarinimicrobiota bacterium]